MTAAIPTWSGALHLSVRVASTPSPWLRVILESDGLNESEILSQLPFQAARSQSGSGLPDSRRYRDVRQVAQTMGLAYEGPAGRVIVTDFGHATARWLPEIRPSNAPALGRHAACALAACQLRNPMRTRAQYGPEVQANPFAYLWRAMLRLEDVISSEELNRGLFYATDEDTLTDAIDRIKRSRDDPMSGALQPEVETGARKNDRIIPIIAAASFGYCFMQDKRETGGDYYRLRPETKRVVESAAMAQYPFREFSKVAEYVEYISTMAALPKDIR